MRRHWTGMLIALGVVASGPPAEAASDRPEHHASGIDGPAEILSIEILQFRRVGTGNIEKENWDRHGDLASGAPCYI